MTDDHQLFTAWGAGDRAAGAALVARYYDAIERFFATKAGEHADDLVQQTFLACAESSASFRGDGSFRGYLYGIARNVLREHIRKRVRDGRKDPDFSTNSIVDLVPGVSTVVAQRAEERRLITALQRIPVDLQILLELFYWEDLSIDELAQSLDIPPGTVKSRLFRARSLLKDAFDALPAGDTDASVLDRWLARVRGA